MSPKYLAWYYGRIRASTQRFQAIQPSDSRECEKRGTPSTNTSQRLFSLSRVFRRMTSSFSATFNHSGISLGTVWFGIASTDRNRSCSVVPPQTPLSSLWIAHARQGCLSGHRLHTVFAILIRRSRSEAFSGSEPKNSSVGTCSERQIAFGRSGNIQAEHTDFSHELHELFGSAWGLYFFASQHHMAVK